jgi:hypothetical protein
MQPWSLVSWRQTTSALAERITSRTELHHTVLRPWAFQTRLAEGFKRKYILNRHQTGPIRKLTRIPHSRPLHSHQPSCKFEAFEHAHKAVCAEGCDETCFRLVFLLHVNLVIARKAIEQRHYFTSCCGINDFVDSWQREIVLWTDFIEIGEVYAHSPFSIFILYHHNIKPSGVIDGFDEFCFQ